MLVISIITRNPIIIFTEDQKRNIYFAQLTTTTVMSGREFAIALLMVYTYKTKQVQFPHQFRIREDAMHFSICTFLGLWFAV
jgi:hypothetical protein